MGSDAWIPIALIVGLGLAVLALLLVGLHALIRSAVLSALLEAERRRTPNP